MTSEYYSIDLDDKTSSKFNPEAICDCRNCFPVCRLFKEPLSPIAQQMRDAMTKQGNSSLQA